LKWVSPSGPVAATPVLGDAAFGATLPLQGPHVHLDCRVGEVENYEDIYRLCYVRGPEGIILEPAEKIG